LLYIGHDGLLRAGEITSGLMTTDVLWAPDRSANSTIEIFNIFSTLINYVVILGNLIIFIVLLSRKSVRTLQKSPKNTRKWKTAENKKTAGKKNYTYKNLVFPALPPLKVGFTRLSVATF
jgi:hypothetical protein